MVEVKLNLNPWEGNGEGTKIKQDLHGKKIPKKF